MGDNYFSEVIKKLTIDDISILAILHDDDATEVFKAMKASQVLKASEMTEAVFRKVIVRLEATRFIEKTTSSRHTSIYITEFGRSALLVGVQSKMKGDADQ